MEPRTYEDRGVRDDWKGRADFFMPGLDIGTSFVRWWEATLRASVCVVFFSFFWPCRGMWDLSSPTRDQTWAPSSGNAES